MSERRETFRSQSSVRKKKNCIFPLFQGKGLKLEDVNGEHEEGMFVGVNVSKEGFTHITIGIRYTWRPKKVANYKKTSQI